MFISIDFIQFYRMVWLLGRERESNKNVHVRWKCSLKSLIEEKKCIRGVWQNSFFFLLVHFFRTILIVPGLSPDTFYSFRVRAENSIGPGPPTSIQGHHSSHLAIQHLFKWRMGSGGGVSLGGWIIALSIIRMLILKFVPPIYWSLSNLILKFVHPNIEVCPA